MWAKTRRLDLGKYQDWIKRGGEENRIVELNLRRFLSFPSAVKLFVMLLSVGRLIPLAYPFQTAKKNYENP